MRTELTLPYPPSVNQLYATNWKTKKRFKTGTYNSWLNAAGWILKSQRRNQHEGKVAVTYFAKKPDNRKRDIDNLAKALLDLLTKHQVIKDDQDVHVLHCAWNNDIVASKIHVTVEDL